MAKEKGLDGKACWKGYKLAGTKKKGGKTVDNCVKEATKKEEGKFHTSLDKLVHKTFGSSDEEKKKEKATTQKEGKSFAQFCAEADEVAEQAGDGYIGPRSLGIKNPMASDATRAATDARAKNLAKKRLAGGGQTTGNIVDRIQQRKEMINAIGEETVTIEDAEGNPSVEIVNLIAPGPMTGWRQDVAEKLDLKKPQWGTL